MQMENYLSNYISQEFLILMILYCDTYNVFLFSSTGFKVNTDEDGVWIIQEIS